MIENNINKTEINVILFNFPEGTVDLNPLIDTTHKGLLYVGDKLGKPIVDTSETLLLRFKDLVDSKCSAIPETNRIPPNMRIAKGVLENVINLEAHETTLQEMFANLLAGSMDNRKSEGVHPSYAKIISELSEEDAKFLVLLFENGMIPSLFVREYSEQEGYTVISNKNLTENYTKDIYILEAKGLLNRKGGLFSSDPNKEGHLKYNKFTEAFQRLENNANLTKKGDRIRCNPNLLTLTSFGKEFMQAVTLKESPTDEES